MKIIHKFPIRSCGRETVFIKGFIQLLDVQMQGTRPCLWALVDTNILNETVVGIHSVGTGQEMPLGDVEYLSTYQEGPYVWHVFWEIL